MSPQALRLAESPTCWITGMGYVPHAVLRKLKIPDERGVMPIQKQYDKIELLRNELDRATASGDEDLAKDLRRELNARERVLNTIERHLDPERQSGKGWKFRIGGTPYNPFRNAWFERSSELKEFAENPSKFTKIPPEKRGLVQRFITRLEDIGLNYPVDTGELKPGSNTSVIESSEDVRIYPFLNIPVSVYTACDSAKRIRKVWDEKTQKYIWFNRCAPAPIAIERAFDPDNVGVRRRGRPKKGEPPLKPIDSTIGDAFIDVATVLKNAITMNQKRWKVSEKDMNEISSSSALKELNELLAQSPRPQELTVRHPDGTVIRGEFYERRKRYRSQHRRWKLGDENEYNPVENAIYTPICAGEPPEDRRRGFPTDTLKGCNEAGKFVVEKSEGQFTCKMRGGVCHLMQFNPIPAGVPKNLHNVWGIRTPLMTDLKTCAEQVKE